ncbi:hypothetical protein TIFTF001_028052 [Ficus carica]|uniref:F-box domain-containing protein n=1 Tax=Ficus carica TaxID=3494 RepID=A0AA88DQB3_FICCA|nr:hypothetical protein TIFTF001_028052 [Ficus carica]
MDIFSNLPDDVAHVILSSLSMEDTSRLRVVSKRCRQLCLSTPFLNFDIPPYMRYPAQRAALMDYIERAVSLKVKYLVIKLSLESGSRYLTLPSSVLCSAALEILVVSFHHYGVGALIKTPSLQSMSSLKQLKLKAVRIDESFGNWISSCCTLLKTLQLNDIKGATRLVITSSSLEELAISSPHDSLLHLQVSAEMLRLMILDWSFDSPTIRVLQLSTSKLKVLYWKGNILNLSVAEIMKNLQISKICLKPFSDNSSANRNILHAIRSSKGLALYHHCVQDLLKLGCPPILFADLLALRIWTTDANVTIGWSSLSSFLKGSPKLQLLCIGNGKIQTCSNKSEDGELPFLIVLLMYFLEQQVGCRSRELEDIPFLYNLKFATIEVVSEKNNELELIESILKNAQNLKKMTVFSSFDSQLDLIREISGYEKASSDAEVNFATT